MAVSRGWSTTHSPTAVTPNPSSVQVLVLPRSRLGPGSHPQSCAVPGQHPWLPAPWPLADVTPPCCLGPGSLSQALVSLALVQPLLGFDPFLSGFWLTLDLQPLLDPGPT